MYQPVDKRFSKGELLLAKDLNRLVERLNRLESLSTNGLISNIGNDSVNIALPGNLPETEFIITNEDVEADDTRLFEGLILEQDLEGNFFSSGESLYFKNIFNCRIGPLKRALVIKFPRGNGEWIWIPKACQQSSSSGL